MSKFVINPNANSSRVVEAEKFALKDDYFFFYDSSDQVVSINKAQYVDRIDLLK